jgi:hypothetical protein
LCVRYVWSHPEAVITQRLEARVRRDFGPADADVVLALLAEIGPDLVGLQEDLEQTERVLAAIVLVADGNSQRFLSAAESARRDWRNVLMGAELGNEGWRNRLAEVLGPA